MTLMAAGLRWGDELVHPKAPGVAARVRLADLVEVDGEEMPLMAATRRFATAGPGGPALADWHARGIRIGDAFGLEHPRPNDTGIMAATEAPDAPVVDEAAVGVAASTDPVAPSEPARGQNYSLF